MPKQNVFTHANLKSPLGAGRQENGARIKQAASAFGRSWKQCRCDACSLKDIDAQHEHTVGAHGQDRTHVCDAHREAARLEGIQSALVELAKA